MDLDLAGLGKSSEQGIAGKQNAPAIDLRQGKRKPIMNGKPGLCANDISGAGDLRAWKIDYLKTAIEQCPLLVVREAQQLIFKQSVGDQELEGQ
jgi:hypothetical protein